MSQLKLKNAGLSEKSHIALLNLRWQQIRWELLQAEFLSPNKNHQAMKRKESEAA